MNLLLLFCLAIALGQNITVDHDRYYLNLQRQAVRKKGTRIITYSRLELDIMKEELILEGEEEHEKDCVVCSEEESLVINLEGTVYLFKEEEEKMLVLSGEQAKMQRIAITLNRSALQSQYSFVYDHAPLVWLNDPYPQKYRPSSLSFAMQHLQAKNIGGEVWLSTKEEIREPFEDQAFFHGEDGNEPDQRLVYTLILPRDDLPHSYASLVNGYNVTAYYFFYYPYNVLHGLLDHHVSDIEHAYIKYTDRRPDRLGVSIHTWGKEVSFSSAQLQNGHPVLYSSYGSHATYLSSGFQGISLDLCGQEQLWSTFENLQLVFPWDVPYVLTDSQPMSVFSQISYFGNPASSVPNNALGLFRSGPSGFLSKTEIAPLLKQLDYLNITCEGHEKSRCLWPLGIFSMNRPLCLPGYKFSYTDSTCYIQPFDPEASGSFECQPNDSCGLAYQMVSLSTGLFSTCYTACMPSGNTFTLEYPHLVCSIHGKWITPLLNPQPSNTFDLSIDRFNCQYNLY